MVWTGPHCCMVWTPVPRCAHASCTQDEEDPFYMPMAPVAIKMAEASKFSLLAEPLGPAQAKPFMIKLEPSANNAGEGRLWALHPCLG